ncbi:MAG: PadR family transcriptional regulator, partial [Euryarchaeota archaeon]|nr:PadR family transcriptional regulator [Euryarchaeota archaeon]
MKKRSLQIECCDMRGMLSFLILWLLSKKSMCGEEIANEIARLRGEKPTPGTIYPALKLLEERKAITSEKRGRRVICHLTE